MSLCGYALRLDVLSLLSRMITCMGDDDEVDMMRFPTQSMMETVRKLEAPSLSLCFP